MITAQWNFVIQARVLASLTRERPERTGARDERSRYESPVTKHGTNRPTKQRDLFQAT